MFGKQLVELELVVIDPCLLLYATLAHKCYRNYNDENSERADGNYQMLVPNFYHYYFIIIIKEAK